MISRNISRRLERLENLTMPVRVQKRWQIVIVDSDGSRRDGPILEWPRVGPGPTLSELFRGQLEPAVAGR